MPSHLGSCRVLQRIATGAISEVYLAVQEPLGRQVVVKALKSSVSTSSSFARHLEREAALLSELSHPNIVVLHEFVKTEGEAYLVLEYVEGPDLGTLLTRRPRVAPEAAAIIGASLARALEHTHERGIVHRDIKPGNVLVSLRGEVKLLDYGIAQRLRGRTAEDADPFDTQTFGTPAYMSPEQILGDTADARSDLFSLGVVLYQMVAGARPFESEDTADRRAATQRIRRAPATPLRDLAPDVPSSFERIVMRLLEKLPADRYATAAAVAEDLDTLVGLRVRGSPRGVIARVLRDAGFSKTHAPDGEFTDAAAPPLRPVYAGFLAIVAVGAAVGAAIQLSDPAARDAAHAGEAPLALLPRDHAALRVLATPWADVSVDGEHVDTTPFARPIPLSAGRHFVTLTHPSAAPERRAIRVAAGETQLLEVTMHLRSPEPESRDAATATSDAAAGGGS